MSHKEKKNYVSNVLFLLLENFPDDDNLAEFVALGKRELIRTQSQRIIFLLKSPRYMYMASIFLSIVLFLNFS